MIEGVNDEGGDMSARPENKGGNLSDLAAFVKFKPRVSAERIALTSDSKLREENQ